ncbi:uncharacterized [Tachysurus ichikawai]
MHSITDKPAFSRRACWDETQRPAMSELWPSNTPPLLSDLVYGVEWVTSKRPSQCGGAKEGTAGGSGVEKRSGFKIGVRGKFVGLIPLIVVIREGVFFAVLFAGLPLT